MFWNIAALLSKPCLIVNMIDVPSDGLCFYHCLGALLLRNTESFRSEDARSIRTAICEKLVEPGWDEEPERLLLQGQDGYPDELAV